MFLVIPASTAYVQHFWTALRSQPATIENVDSMFDVLGNAWKFLNLKLWFGSPVLAALAVVPWLIPFAAVFTLATLSVDLRSQTRNFITEVPRLDFSAKSTEFASITVQSFDIGGPDPQLSRSAITAAVQGSIIPMKAEFPNSTYSLGFHAPALKCGLANQSYSDAFDAKIATADSETEGAQGINYMTWVGSGADSIPTISVNFSPGGNGPELLDTFSQDSAKVSIAVDSRLYVCSLNNASYSVDFKFIAGQQTLDVRLNKYLNGVIALNSSNPAWSNSKLMWIPFFNETIAYASIMQAFGQIVIGQVNTNAQGTQNSDSALVQSTYLGRFLTAEIIPPAHVFAETVQELFQNITMSLFSISKYHQDPATAPQTPITVVTIRNTYIYKPAILYLAYGLALICTLLSVLLECIDILRNRASFSNSFSTVLRTTRDEGFNGLVAETDASGRDPLPKHLADVRVSYDELGLHCLTDQNGSSEKGPVDEEMSNGSSRQREGQELEQEPAPEPAREPEPAQEGLKSGGEVQRSEGALP